MRAVYTKAAGNTAGIAGNELGSYLRSAGHWPPAGRPANVSLLGFLQANNDGTLALEVQSGRAWFVRDAAAVAEANRVAEERRREEEARRRAAEEEAERQRQREREEAAQRERERQERARHEREREEQRQRSMRSDRNILHHISGILSRTHGTMFASEVVDDLTAGGFWPPYGYADGITMRQFLDRANDGRYKVTQQYRYPNWEDVLSWA